MRSDRNCLVSGVTKGTTAVRGGGGRYFSGGANVTPLCLVLDYRGEKAELS